MVEVGAGVQVAWHMKGIKNLTDIIYQYEDATFSWGEFDCCIFTASIVEEFTGRSLPHWRNVLQYPGPKGAAKALKKLG